MLFILSKLCIIVVDVAMFVLVSVVVLPIWQNRDSDNCHELSRFCVKSVETGVSC